MLPLLLAVAFSLSVAAMGVSGPPWGTEKFSSQTPPLFVRLKAAAFDPLRGEPKLPLDLKLTSYPAGESGYFIVQFNGPIRAEWKGHIEELGGVLS
ncbi:MAG: hypothetical protein NZ934_03775, partial [Hadesarchaea archaeon]|nr:hypothetical protein [Hadesarchaea archaeon]